MADYFSATALPEIINNNLEDWPTSIDLLLFKRSPTSLDSVLEVDGNFKNDILDLIVFDYPNINGLDNAQAAASSLQPFLQILFMSSVRDPAGCTTKRLRVNPNILESISSRFGICSAFLEAVLVPSIWSKQSGATYWRYDDEGNATTLDGFYHYFENWDLGPLHVWFSYNVLTRSTTYVLVDCCDAAKKRIEKTARSQETRFLFQPLALDFLIAEECASWRETFINERWKELFQWHDLSGNKMDAPIRAKVLNPNNLQNLHTLSRTWNMLYEDLGDLEERLDFLIETSKKLDLVHIRNSTSAAEAFQFLHARNKVRRRWITSFAVRTKLISKFVFSFAAQKVNQATLDNAEENKRNTKTNLEIQRQTTKIANEAAKDNSSMITIANMTMLFLPGTFISAIFSMVFFTFNSGDGTVDVSPWIWLYVAVTVPLTALVFGFYLYWRRHRESRRGQDSDADLELGLQTSSDNGALA